MTREEAIKILKAISVYECYPKSASEETKEAIDMAIEALSNNITESPNGAIKPSNDVINRADAIKAVAKLQKYDFDERNRLRIYAPWHKPKRIFVETEAIYKCIYTMPSADAVSREEYEEVKAYMDTLVDAFIEDGEEIAESVKVVRCKDCKHLKTMCEDEGTCYYWCKHWNNATDDWGHCYYGERREL